jgi:hypothetical protein
MNRFAVLSVDSPPEDVPYEDLLQVVLDTHLKVFTPNELCLLSQVNRYTHARLGPVKETFQFVMDEIPRQIADKWVLDPLDWIDEVNSLSTTRWIRTKFDVAFTDPGCRTLWCNPVVDGCRYELEFRFSDDWGRYTFETTVPRH